MFSLTLVAIKNKSEQFCCIKSSRNLLGCFEKNLFDRKINGIKALWRNLTLFHVPILSRAIMVYLYTPHTWQIVRMEVDGGKQGGLRKAGNFDIK